MSKKELFFVEVTDTFAGEANYSWVTRHRIRAKSARGAIWKISRGSGLSWRKNWSDGDCTRYDSASGATCAFVSAYDPEYHSEYRFSTDDMGS